MALGCSMTQAQSIQTRISSEELIQYTVPVFKETDGYYRHCGLMDMACVRGVLAHRGAVGVVANEIPFLAGDIGLGCGLRSQAQPSSRTARRNPQRLGWYHHWYDSMTMVDPP